MTLWGTLLGYWRDVKSVATRRIGRRDALKPVDIPAIPIGCCAYLRSQPRAHQYWTIAADPIHSFPDEILEIPAKLSKVVRSAPASPPPPAGGGTNQIPRRTEALEGNGPADDVRIASRGLSHAEVTRRIQNLPLGTLPCPWPSRIWHQPNAKRSGTFVLQMLCNSTNVIYFRITYTGKICLL